MPKALTKSIRDVVAGRYSDVQLSAFVTAASSLPLSDDETFALTKAMVDAGEQLHWDSPVIVDKHSVGGLPGQSHAANDRDDDGAGAIARKAAN